MILSYVWSGPSKDLHSGNLTWQCKIQHFHGYQERCGFFMAMLVHRRVHPLLSSPFDLLSGLEENASTVRDPTGCLGFLALLLGENCVHQPAQDGKFMEISLACTCGAKFLSSIRVPS